MTNTNTIIMMTSMIVVLLLFLTFFNKCYRNLYHFQVKYWHAIYLIKINFINIVF